MARPRVLNKTEYADLAARVLATIGTTGSTRSRLATRLDVDAKYVYQALDGSPRRPGLLLRMAHELAIPIAEAA